MNVHPAVLRHGISEPGDVARLQRQLRRGDSYDGWWELSTRLERLHSEESELLRERDQLIEDLRLLDTSWNLIALRSGISRQALSKRAR